MTIGIDHKMAVEHGHRPPAPVGPKTPPGPESYYCYTRWRRQGNVEWRSRSPLGLSGRTDRDIPLPVALLERKEIPPVSRPLVIEVLPAMTPRVNASSSSHVDVRTASRPDPETLIQEAQGAVALIRVVDLPYRIGGDIFDRVPSIQVVTASGSGADCYDVQAASDRGIPVLHNPGVAARPVVEYVLGSIVAPDPEDDGPQSLPVFGWRLE